jgi:hypothetical protein
MEENIDDLSKQQTIQQRPKLVMCNLQQKYTNHFHICSIVFNETKGKRQLRFVLGLLLRTEAIKFWPLQSSVVNPDDLSQLMLINHIHIYVFQHRGPINHHLSFNI